MNMIKEISIATIWLVNKKYKYVFMTIIIIIRTNYSRCL